MSEDALGTRISDESSSGRVDLSRMMLGWVGVESGVKDRGQLPAPECPGNSHPASDRLTQRPVVPLGRDRLRGYGAFLARGSDRAPRDVKTSPATFRTFRVACRRGQRLPPPPESSKKASPPGRSFM